MFREFLLQTHLSHPVWQLPLLFVLGVLAGINNVLAGGGSLVVMPALMFMGLDGATANGTNRLAILIQNISAVAGFRRYRVGNPAFSLMLAAPAVPGVVIGAFYASTISDGVFRRILSVVMIGVLILILSKRKRGSQKTVSEEDVSRGRKIAAMAAFMFIGFYAGFIQAGVGFLVIGSLVGITGLDLVRVNAHKVLIIGTATVFATIVFAWFGRIIWSVGLILAAGNALGAWLGVNVAVAGGEKWIKRVLTVAVLAMAVKLSGLTEWLF